MISHRKRYLEFPLSYSTLNMANQFSVATVSLLDTDLYKLTMHAAVFTNFPQARECVLPMLSSITN